MKFKKVNNLPSRLDVSYKEKFSKMGDNFDSTMALLASEIPNVTVQNPYVLASEEDGKEVLLGSSNRDGREKKLRYVL